MSNTLSLRGYFHSYEPEYKRIYICISNDEFTEKFLESKQKQPGTNPVWITRSMNDGRPPGFFIKYNGKLKCYANSILCTFDELLNQHIIAEVEYKTYKYKDKYGWNLLCHTILKNK
jgi:hypothetical protein